MGDNFEQLSENIDLNLFPEHLHDPEIIYPIDDTPIPSGELEVGWSWIPQNDGIFNWTDGNNWVGPVAGGYPNNLNTDRATINAILDANNTTINLNQNISLSNLILSSSSNNYGFSINGGSPSGLLTIATGIIFNPTATDSPYGYGIHNINCNIDLASTNVFFIAGKNSSSSLNFNGNIKPTSGSNKTLIVSNSNAGTIRINGSLDDNGTNRLSFTKSSSVLNKVYLSNSNTYTGQTTIIGSNSSPLYFNSIENINSINPSSFGKPILANEQILIGLNTTGGYISYNGIYHSSNRSFLLRHHSGISTFEISSSGILILSGIVSTINGNSSTDIRTLRFSGIGTGHFPSIPFHSVGITNVEKLGIGKWIFSDKNYYLGTTRIGGGILQFSKKLSLYSNQAGTDVILPFWSKSKIYTVRDGNATLAMSVGGSGEFTSADISTLLTNLGGDIPTSSGGLTRNSYWGFDTTNAPSGIFNLTESIANTSGYYGGAIGLKKLGSNTLVLSGNSTYTYDTTIESGTIRLGNINGLGSKTSPTNINNNGTLDLNSYTINKSGTITINSGTITNGAVIGSCSYVIKNATSNATLGGTGSLTKTGSDTFVIENNTNTYSGYTEIKDGTIEINSISNSGIPGSFGIGKFINTSWQPGYSDTPPTILYTGSGDVSSNKDFNIFSTFTKIESNSPSGSISFTGKIYAQPTRRKDYSYLTQIGPTFSAWLPADPANYIPNPYVWSFNVFRFTSTTNYVSAETLSALIPAVVDTNNPPQTFFFNNRKEIIDLIKVQLGVVDISSPPYYPYYGSPLTVDTYWQSYSSDQLNLCGSSKSSKNTMNLVRVFDPYGSTPSLPIVKTGSGTWSLTGQSSIILSLFPITHKEGTLIINSQTAGSYQPFVIEGNNTNNDILLLFDTPPESLNTSTFVVKNIPNNKQNIYIGSITKHNEYIGIGSWSDSMFIDNAITLMANKYLVVESRINGSYELGYDVPNPANHDIYIGTPEYRGSVIITSIISSKSILVNYGSLLMNSYGWNARAEIERCYLNNSTSLGGQGPLKGLVEGPGNICPSVSPILGPDLNVNHGFLAIQQLDPSEGTNFHFTFSDTDIGWIYIDQYTRFISNDVLCLCDIIYQPDYYYPGPVPPDGIANRLVTSLSPSNEINLYFPSSIEHGQTYKGGFLVQDEPNLVSKLSNATYNLYVKTNSGNIVYNGQNYALLNSNYSVTVNAEFYSESNLSEEIGLLPIPSGYLSTFTINVT